MIQEIVFSNSLQSDQSSLLLFSFPEYLLNQVRDEQTSLICSQEMEQECTLVTDKQIHRLLRTQNQNITLVAQKDHQLTIKSNTQTIVCVQESTPQYHLIYNYLKDKLLDSYEENLKKQYESSFMFTEYKDKYFWFSDMVHINLLRLIQLLLTERKLEKQSFTIDLIEDKLIQSFMEQTLSIYAKQCDGRYQLDFIEVARSVILELLIQKEDFIFEELVEAFWMILPTYYEFDTQDIHNDRLMLFYGASSGEVLVIDNNAYHRELKDLNNYILRKVNKHQLSYDPLERMRQLSTVQPKFLFEQIQSWLKMVGQGDKEILDFVGKKFKIITLQVHPQNIKYIIQVYPYLDAQNLSTIQFYLLK